MTAINFKEFLRRKFLKLQLNVEATRNTPNVAIHAFQLAMTRKKSFAKLNVQIKAASVRKATLKTKAENASLEINVQVCFQFL